MTSYQVTFVGADGQPQAVVQVPDDEYVLDAVDEAGVDLPLSVGCRLGTCPACAVTLVSGVVDQDDQVYLSEEQQRAGLVLACVTYVESDCVFDLAGEEAVRLRQEWDDEDPPEIPS